MNIFASDHCPIQSAKNLDTKRQIKMILESCQLLCTAVTLNGGTAPYKPTHVNHPATIWTRQTRSNYIWLFNHFVALLEEYERKFNRRHKCEQYVMELWDARSNIPGGLITTFANCTRNLEHSIDHRSEPDVHKAYKLYLQDRWEHDKRQPTWD